MIKKFKFIHKTGKVFRDERGYLLKILDKGFSSCIEIFSKKGTIRANHYHKKDEHFCYVLKGEILFFYRNRKKGSKLNHKIMKKGDLFFTTYDQDHLAYFLKTTHFLSYSSRKRTKIDYENDLVRLNMDKEAKIKEIISKYK
jgi:quercetin dioxygenase-like cupin family protein|tara:strand:+ start:819 stop:1244 length:426 start_codon:yes stop_codon:yes gene_type:complete